VRELRFSDESTIPVNGQPQPLRNHAKVVIVDDAAAYIGSQNLYPGGMAARPPIQQLGEFGYVIVGPEVPALVLDDYWNRMWPLARSRR
jgi:phosphatidylserine/phosphatidylglycerophosphate/cardiolipin synthase-like enzyme